MNNFFITVLFVSKIFNSYQQNNCPPPLKDCSKDNISFFLYTADNETPQELILNDPQSLKNVIFNENAKFKVIIHGYRQSKDDQQMKNLRQEYFKNKSNNWNLIYVDYKPLAIDGCYFDTAAPSAPQLGQCTATLLEQLFNQRPDINISKFHFIGYSMGAQVCAQISNNLRPDLKIPRITGCDPAKPGFVEGPVDSMNKLNKQHAEFVDAIHTNSGTNGVESSNAHYDIYVNDGADQPGCNGDDVCSHLRSLQIFIESINSSTKFIAVKCDNFQPGSAQKACRSDHEFNIEVGEYCLPPNNVGFFGYFDVFPINICYSEAGKYHLTTHEKYHALWNLRESS